MVSKGRMWRPSSFLTIKRTHETHQCGALQSSLGAEEKGRWGKDWTERLGRGSLKGSTLVPCPAHKSTRSARPGFQRVLLGSFPPPCLDPGGGAEVAARPAASPARYSLAASPLQHRPDRAMSAEPELIELRELAPSGRIGPGRTRLERANALRIAPGTTRNPSQQHVPGRGHRFQPAGPTTHTWCDLCGDFIWGVVRKGLQCTRE